MKYIGITSPCWSIRGKAQNKIEEKIKLENSNIGPGLYNLDKVTKMKFKKSPEWKLGIKKNPSQNMIKTNDQIMEEKETNKKEKEEKIKKRLEKISKTQKPINKGTFGESKRSENFCLNNKNPGPGAYERGSDLKSLKIEECKMASKSYACFQMFDNKLGPGSYHPTNLNWQKGQKIYFKRLQKQNEKKMKSFNNNQLSEVKGKDEFNKPRILKKNNDTFAKNIRMEKQINNNYPGPGAYQDINLNSKSLSHFKNNSISFGRKIPIPNQMSHKNDKFYNLKSSLSQQGYKFAKKTRFSSIKNSKNTNEEENSKNEIFSKKSKADIFKDQKGFSFGMNVKNVNFINENPGPGSYNFASSFKIQKTMDNDVILKTGISNILKDNGIPGPGHYDIDANYKFKNPEKWSFANNSLKNAKQSLPKILDLVKKGKIANPPYYNIRWELDKKGFSFQKNKRFCNDEKENLGPGYYKLKSTIPQNQPWLHKNFEDSFDEVYENYIEYS